MRRRAVLHTGLWLWLVFPVMALTGCDALFPSPQKPKPPAVSYEAQSRQYMTDLAIARILLDQSRSENEMATAKSFLQSMNAFKAQPHKKTDLTLTALVMEYTIEGQKGKHKSLVPLSSQAQRFDALQEVLKKLSGSPYTMHNLQTFHLSFAGPGKEKFSTTDSVALRQQLAEEQHKWLIATRALPLKENAELQLALVRFFMQQRIRDAAYLALENAKMTLAQITVKSPEQKQELLALSKEVEILENNLHRDMPYNL